MSRRKRPPGKKTGSAGHNVSSRGSDRPKAEPHQDLPTLGQEDAKLWAAVTKSLQPIKKQDERLHFGPLLDDKPSIPQKSFASGRSARAKNKAPLQNTPSALRHGKASHDTLPVARRVPDLSQFTRREMRQVTTGRQPIEATLDLHGLRQAEAHMALRGFLLQAQDQGLRHVLVITGKGRAGSRDDLMFMGHEPGVLRRQVPLWLAEAELRLIVGGFTEAPLRHGGEGALYVRLRRAR